MCGNKCVLFSRKKILSNLLLSAIFHFNYCICVIISILHTWHYKAQGALPETSKQMSVYEVKQGKHEQYIWGKTISVCSDSVWTWALSCLTFQLIHLKVFALLWMLPQCQMTVLCLLLYFGVDFCDYLKDVFILLIVYTWGVHVFTTVSWQTNYLIMWISFCEHRCMTKWSWAGVLRQWCVLCWH